MSYTLNQEEIEKIKNIKGEVRGAVFKTDEHFIKRELGEEGVKKVEEEIKKMGGEINYEEIDRMDFYPLSLRVFSLLAISSVLNYSQEEIKKVGEMAPRVSFLVKFFTKYFMSVSQTLGKVTELWEKHYTVGRIEAVNVSEKEGVATFRLYDADFHPVFCHYLVGYFSSVVSMVVGAKIESKETKCYFKGDEYHEFHLTWDPQEGK